MPTMLEEHFAIGEEQASRGTRPQYRSICGRVGEVDRQVLSLYEFNSEEKVQAPNALTHVTMFA
jgi:uncharacterized metal-binding protein